MIRSDEYKLEYRLKDKHGFYDLTDDPLEMVNVYDRPEYQNIIVEFKEKLLQILIETEDNLPFNSALLA